jgi:hypothetical protein
MVWLGPCDEELEASFELSESIYSIAIRESVALGALEYSPNFRYRLPLPKRLSQQETLSVALPPFPDRPWDELFTLISKPRFSRVWVVQEVAVGITAAVVALVG